MPDLRFSVEQAEPVAFAASPHLSFRLRIEQICIASEVPAEIHNVALRCQIRLEPGRRRYSPPEQEKLGELFGEPQRWGQTVRSMLWANVATTLPSFARETRADLLVPCTYDFNIAQTKYFHALQDGQVPVSFLFSGTIFYAGEDGSLQVEQISWEKETTFKLDVSVWQRMMDMYYPNSAWLCLRRDVFDELDRYKRNNGATSWEQAVERLLDSAKPSAGIQPARQVAT